MPAIDAQREQSRLDALARYDVLDTPGEESFDRITRLVRRILKVPMSTVTFLDGHRQWFKSRQGIAACEGDRRIAFCDLVLRYAEPLIVPDTWLDPRFAESELVTGPPRLRFYAGFPLLSYDGHILGTLCALDTTPRQLAADEREILSDLARIVMTELELRLVATTDGLTGALSRRAFHDEAERALALARRHQHETSCILFDLDHFKAVNDRHGHASGDAVLSGSARLCRAMLRMADRLGRLGGEEFAVLLPHTGREGAMILAERLRQAIAGQSFEARDGRFGVTASFGVATLGPGPGDVATMLRRADEALYVAKSAGRDRCVASPADGHAGASGKPVLKAGRIVLEGGPAVDCTVRRLSPAGASLGVTDPAGVPDRFKLAIEADAFARACQVADRAGGEIEVQFS